MSTTKNGFNFEQFVVEQLKTLTTKIDGLAGTYLTRDEAVLYKKERDEKLDAISSLINQHATVIANLKETDDRQQGGIDANRRTLNIFLTVMGFAAVLIAGYIGVMHR